MKFEEYRRFDAMGLAEQVAGGHVGARELLDAAVARMVELQPSVNAITQQHLEQAHAAISAGLPAGPFTGVPFLLKDMTLQLEGTVTSNGSALFGGTPATGDSTLVARYKRAGLVIFGKTNTPEMALGVSTEPRMFGPTRNPWDGARTVGGSSGGSAAAVAAGIVPAAQGSDGGGSLRIPASCCGLFGLKPTRGRTPYGPWWGEGWAGLSSLHVITRSVRDSAAMLDATHGPEPGDPYEAPPTRGLFRDALGHPPPRLRVALHTVPLYGTPVDGECLRAARKTARLLIDLGHRVEEAVLPGNAHEVGSAHWALCATGMTHALNRRALALGRPLREDDVEPETWQAVEFSRTLDADAYFAAVQAMHRQGRQMARFHEDFDVVLSPTLGRLPFGLLPNDLRPSAVEFSPFCNVFNMTGQPSMSVPLHWTSDGIPVGSMFSAGFGREDLLFSLAAELERAAPWSHRFPEAM